MNGAADLLKTCQDRGVAIWADGDQLRYRAPRGVVDQDLLDRLLEHKTGLLDALRSGTSPSPAADPYAPFPLTDIQSAFVLGRDEHLAYGGVGCHGYGELTAAEIVPERLERAFRVLIERHPMLRAVIDRLGTQQVMPIVSPYEVEVHDLREASPDEIDRAIAMIRADLDHRVYRPDQWPLFELHVTRTPSRDIAHLSIDFLVADFLSLQILLDELEIEYLSSGSLDPAGPEAQFSDYVTNLSPDLQSRDYKRDRDYWLSIADTLPFGPTLPMLPASSSPPRFARLTLFLSPAQRGRLAARARGHGLTVNSVLLTSYAAALRRRAQRPQFTLNVTVLDRSPCGPGLARVVGDFTRVLLLAVDDPQSRPFAQWAAGMQDRLLEGMAHPRYGGVELMRELRRSHPGVDPLFPVVFTSSLGLSGDQGPTGYLRLSYGISQTPQVWLDCQVMEGADGGLVINWDYREHALPDGLVAELHDDFAGALRNLSRPGTLGDDAWLEPLAPVQPDPRRSESMEHVLRALPGIVAAAVVEGPGAGATVAVVAGTVDDAGAIRIQPVLDVEQLAADAIVAERDFRRSVDDQSMINFVDQLDRTALLQMMAAFVQLGLFARPNAVHDLNYVLHTARVAPAHHRMVRRWLRALVENGYLELDPAGYRCRQPISATDVAEGWQLVDRHTPRIEQRSELVEYFRVAGASLPQLLDGSIKPLDLLFPQAQTAIHEVAYSATFMSRYLNQLLFRAVKGLCAHTDERLQILEIGAGVGGTTHGLMDALVGQELEYTFTDVSQFFLNNAREYFADDPRLRFGLLDLNEDPVAVGYRPNFYSVIICANVLHYADNIDAAVIRLRELLRPGGVLLMIEATHDNYQIMTSMEFLFDETTQHFTDARESRDQLFATVDQWRTALANAGADEVAVMPGPDPITDRMGMQVFAARFKTATAQPDTNLIAESIAREFPGQFGEIEVCVLDTLTGVEQRLSRRARNAAPAVSVADCVIPQPPRGEVETMIARAWQQLLGLATLGRDRRFYDVGGDSLLASQIAADLVDSNPSSFGRVGFDRLLRLLLQNATVADLAQIVEVQHAAITTASTLPEVVCTPLGDGEGIQTYVVRAATSRIEASLLTAIGRAADAKLINVVGPDPTTDLDPDATIRAIVSAIIEDGRLRVAVLGIGRDALLTYEVAREIAELGISVDRLVVLVQNDSDSTKVGELDLLPYAGDVDAIVIAEPSEAGVGELAGTIDVLREACLGDFRLRQPPAGTHAETWVVDTVKSLLVERQ